MSEAVRRFVTLTTVLAWTVCIPWSPHDKKTKKRQRQNTFPKNLSLPSNFEGSWGEETNLSFELENGIVMKRLPLGVTKI